MRARASKQVVFPESDTPILMVASGFHHLLDETSLKDEGWLLFLVMGPALLFLQQ